MIGDKNRATERLIDLLVAYLFATYLLALNQSNSRDTEKEFKLLDP